jgi:hypothetical protein
MNRPTALVCSSNKPCSRRPSITTGGFTDLRRGIGIWSPFLLQIHTHLRISHSPITSFLAAGSVIKHRVIDLSHYGDPIWPNENAGILPGSAWTQKARSFAKARSSSTTIQSQSNDSSIMAMVCLVILNILFVARQSHAQSNIYS